MLQIGSPAPTFSLPDQDGKSISLDGLRGRWVVLYFYPKDDTPGCTVEACEFTAALPDFRALDAEVLGCSADGAVAHTKFIAKYKLGIRLLTDADRKVMNAYGAFGEKTMYGKKVLGVIRSTALIDPAGNLAHHWPTVKAEGHAEQVRSRLAELRGGAGIAAPPAPAPSKAKANAKQPKKRAAPKPAKAAKAAKKPAGKAAGKAAGKPVKKPARKVARSAAAKQAKKAKR